jgi:hypothetical protein
VFDYSTSRRHRFDMKRLLPSIDIIETHDVVLAEIAADLNLDQFQRDFSRIGEPVNAADACSDQSYL